MSAVSSPGTSHGVTKPMILGKVSSNYTYELYLRHSGIYLEMEANLVNR